MFSYFACYLFLQYVLDAKGPFERTPEYICAFHVSLEILAL